LFVHPVKKVVRSGEDEKEKNLLFKELELRTSLVHNYDLPVFLLMLKWMPFFQLCHISWILFLPNCKKIST